MNTNKRTLIIGASENPDRYSNMAIRSLRNHDHEVLALAKREGQVGDVKIETAFPGGEVHTVSLYVGPQRQPEYYAPILEMKPHRVIFNPGTENDEFIGLLEENGIETVEGCTLVMLSIGNY